MKTLGAAMLAALILGGVVACGNAGGGGGTVAGGGTGGTGSVAFGSITKVGSIWVNGVEYDTTGAQIALPDTSNQPYTDTNGSVGGNDLKEGMVVTVQGTVNPDGVSGKATKVTYTDNLQGPVDAGSVTATGFTVLGQSILFEQGLTYGTNESLTPAVERKKLTALSDIAVADNSWVEVSGFVDANGAVRARYIEVKVSPTSSGELKGTVSKIASDGTFYIGTVKVIPPANTVSTLGLVDGQRVKVEQGQYAPATQTLTVGKVELAHNALEGVDAADYELEGIVSTVNATNQTFQLSGQPVQWGATTTFEGGTSAGLVSGVRVEVEGPMVSGVVDAHHVKFGDTLELEGNVVSLNPGTSFKLDQLPLLTVAYAPTLTEVQGTIGDGTHVAIRARQDGSGNVFATNIEVSSIQSGNETAVVLQGPLENWDATSLTILGQTITPGLSSLTYTINDQVVTMDQFFQQIKVGALVHLEGKISNTGLTTQSFSWDQLEKD